MTTDIKMEDLIETDSTSEPTEETEETVTEQDPLKEELEKVQKKEPRTEAEKASFTLKKTAERLKELGGDPASILGFKTEVDSDDDDAPVTIGMLKKLEQDKASKTALQLADEIQGETERELVKYHLSNSIRSTGNPAEDLRLARAIVNSVKNSQITEEVTRKTQSKSFSSASSAPMKHEDKIELTQEELLFKKQFGLTDEEIIKSRKS